jgi:ElaB/YqjD/DUF883 family membrane-anchored ribosome-binding protein
MATVAGKATKADIDAKASQSEIEAQIATLREEIAKLSAQVQSSGERSYDAARKIASEGVDHIRAQGEAAVERLRTNATDIEQQLADSVREKPVTSLAIAAGIGFLFALMARR